MSGLEWGGVLPEEGEVVQLCPVAAGQSWRVVCPQAGLDLPVVAWALVFLHLAEDGDGGAVTTIEPVVYVPDGGMEPIRHVTVPRGSTWELRCG